MAGDAMDRVVPLSDLNDFQVADGEPDVRGWDVMASDGQRIGEVEELLIDTTADKVRYLDVDVDRKVLDAQENRHILIPIGYARLDEENNRVMVDELDTSRLATLPVYDRSPLTQESEASLREGFDEARLTLSEERLRVEKERVEAGEVGIDKHVETTHVRQEVPRTREEVIVEHRPATPGMRTDARIEEDEIHVPINEERVRVEKEVVPTEEVVLKKRTVTENETVEGDVRRERADIHRDGDVNIRDERS